TPWRSLQTLSCSDTPSPLSRTRTEFSLFVRTLLIYRTYTCTIVRASLSEFRLSRRGAMTKASTGGTGGSAGTGTNGAPGSQTLARGLAALQLVGAAPNAFARPHEG